MSRARVVRAAIGPSFARRRAAGRAPIGGASPGASTEALARALGPGARLLSAERPLVLDADACSIEGRPLLREEDWLPVLRDGALGRVEGAFALAQLTPSGGLVLARDAIGHRSLYYTLSGDQLFFASTLHALLDAGVAPRRLHLRSVAAYLAYAYIPGRATMAEGVFALEPGEQLTFEHGVLHRSTTWNIPPEPELFEGEEVLRLRLREALEERVRALLPEDAPVAVSLSGGIDSSLIAALAARFNARPTRTFSITFGPAYKDELAWSSLVAEHCGTEHTIVELGAEAIAAHLDDTIACLDKPNGDPLTVPNALLFRAMAEEAPVALNGEGGDPCFGGPKNLPMILSELYGPSDEPKARERSYLRAHLKCYDELDQLFVPGVREQASVPPLEDDLSPWFSDPRWRSLLTRLLAINVRWKGGHHILPKVDALSSPFGILARSPLFARSLVELSFLLPPSLKLKGSIEKYLLKQAVSDLLPPAILERPKSGMMVPVEGWFQGPLLPEARARILDGLAPHGLFQRRYVEDLLAGKAPGLRPRHGVKIWLLVTLEAHVRALGLRL
jgi:asparagine synthase (glutamine-hydrolysing)